MSSIVVLTGGGIKGAVAAARCADQGDVLLVHVDYGQPTARMERTAVGALASSLKNARALPLQAPPLARLGQAVDDDAGSSMGGDDSQTTGELLPAVMRGIVPVLFSVGYQTALRVKASQLVIGLSRVCDAAHLGLGATDARMDGRGELIQAFNIMADTLAPDGPRLVAPLMELTCAEILKLAQRFQVALEHTWTCLHARPQPCAACDPCKARAQAFVAADMADPLVSAAVPG